MTNRSSTDLLTGEWACLGLLTESATHGFALARELSPTGGIGRIWSMSRPLTYRAVDKLAELGFIEARDHQPGLAGGTKTIYASTRAGRAAFRNWVTTPVSHLRELRSDLLLKLEFARRCSIPVDQMIHEQRALIERIRAGLRNSSFDRSDDLVLLWRLRFVDAALAFLDDLDRAAT